MPRLPNCGREMEANDLVFLAPPKTGHQQEICPDAGIAEWYRLIERSHAEPARSLRFQRPRTLHRAMTVSIRLHNCADGYSSADMLLHSAKVLSKGGERNIGPCRTRRRTAQDFYCSRHFRDYSGSGLDAEVTPGLLPQAAAFTPQFVPKMKFTVICVSTSMASPFRMYGR